MNLLDCMWFPLTIALVCIMGFSFFSKTADGVSEIFLIDDLNAQPHEADIQMLLRQCRVHNVPIACNRYSADLMITSTLWDDDSYVPMEPKYVLFKRD